MSFGIAEGSLSMFFKAADGVGKPCEIAAIKFPARFSPSDALRFTAWENGFTALNLCRFSIDAARCGFLYFSNEKIFVVCPCFMFGSRFGLCPDASRAQSETAQRKVAGALDNMSRCFGLRLRGVPLPQVFRPSRAAGKLYRQCFRRQPLQAFRQRGARLPRPRARRPGPLVLRNRRYRPVP